MAGGKSWTDVNAEGGGEEHGTYNRGGLDDCGDDRDWGMAIAQAQTQAPMPYGANVSLENAKKVAAPALAEAEKNHWNMAVAIVDTSGNLVYYEKMDNTQLGSANVAIDKARSAALYKRPTKAFQDALAAGGDGCEF